MIRRATIRDVRTIHKIVNGFAQQQQMLPRSLAELYENVRDFFVCEEDGDIVGCAALHVIWENLGEIKSLAVRSDYQRRGIGSQLVEACLEDARSMGLPRVFALTFHPHFFERIGFQAVPKESLPHKIWAECIRCPRFPDCGESAVSIDLSCDEKDEA